MALIFAIDGESQVLNQVFNTNRLGLFTDLAATSGTTSAPVVTSASHNFVAADVGSLIYISAGTNWLVGWYQIISTATNAATLDHACASTSSPTAGSWNVPYNTQDTILKLYTNNHNPGYTDTASTFSEASGNGYAAIALAGASWGAPSGDDPATIAYPQQTFTFTGALGNVYGYFIVRKNTGTLVLAELFSNGPYNIQNNGDTIKITPTVTAT